MNVFMSTLRDGTMKGLKTTWTLAKVIVPIYIIITILKYTPVIGWIAILFEPVMQLFGLPGEAAIAMVMGNLLNLYAGIGVMATLPLTMKQITIMAVMLSFSHSLLVETAVSKRVGVSIPMILSVRIGLAVISGILLNLTI
ncbi:nucleoside recognition domain-containing protein [Acidaminobacter sp.]|uniref:nucleoside recognition domain-containing protein n=1 Tax=Acidaminobacter sp. TaxID=1872102 RepID=UPI00137D916E|nr:nucleoside recognition domain-containing protein [Acidaminobacter sp.]MDK9711477.1 nucleoside recognition protein [Acidaminobacter sp.]MZQ96201.1 nucleoside recognition protein [Acidaminobacter sp.]